MENLLLTIFTLLFGLGLGIFVDKQIYKKKKMNIDKVAEDTLESANKEAAIIKDNAIKEFKEETKLLKEKTDEEVKEKKKEILLSEEKLHTRDNNLDTRETNLNKRDSLIEEKEKKLLSKQEGLQEKEEKLNTLYKKQEEVLEKLSGYSKEEAKKIIMDNLETKMSAEIADYIKTEENNAKAKMKYNAKQLIVNAMERYSDDVVAEMTVSTINLPSDDMKGRLIGREGRNIRTIEAITGVDLIIDDTPEAIVISSFDPLRREIAKITIEALVKDGRIHPSRIEDLYQKVTDDINAKIMEVGYETINTLGLSRVDNEIVRLIGKLNYRTSYGQNALKHSIEVANLTGLMASELGENVMLARRAGLLHDIGKSIDFEIEGSHVEIGADVAKKYKEHEVVINAIMSHHGECDATSIISELVAIADTLSAARPGARNDSIENYIKRLEELEKIGNSFKGVEKTYAMQAGRELRVMVSPKDVDDAQSYKIAREIKKRVESEMQYPGTVKITVIRETRVLEEAK